MVFSTIFWNYLRQYRTAKFALLFPAIFSVFFTSSNLGVESGEHLALLSIVLIAFMIFDLQDKWGWGLIVGAASICFIVLDITDHQALGPHVIDIAAKRKSYPGNFFATFTVGVTIAIYFQRLSNRQVDDIIFRAQQELKAVFDNSFDAIFLVDPLTHEIEVSNQRGLELFDGEAFSELEGKSANNLLKRPFSEEKIQEIHLRLLDNDRWSWEQE